jgi:hypothetical protein
MLITTPVFMLFLETTTGIGIGVFTGFVFIFIRYKNKYFEEETMVDFCNTVAWCNSDKLAISGYARTDLETIINTFIMHNALKVGGGVSAEKYFEKDLGCD